MYVLADVSLKLIKFINPSVAKSRWQHLNDRRSIKKSETCISTFAGTPLGLDGCSTNITTKRDDQNMYFCQFLDSANIIHNKIKFSFLVLAVRSDNTIH